MITKKQFCEIQINKFCRENNTTKDVLGDGWIYNSSTLAVCMEYLNMLKSLEAKEYVQSRDGILYTYWDKNKSEVFSLSVREFLDLLPEELN